MVEEGEAKEYGSFETAVEEEEAAPAVITRQRLSTEQKAELFRLYTEEGWSAKKCGEKFGKSKGAIQQLLWKLKKEGLPPGK